MKTTEVQLELQVDNEILVKTADGEMFTDVNEANEHAELLRLMKTYIDGSKRELTPRGEKVVRQRIMAWEKFKRDAKTVDAALNQFHEDMETTDDDG